MNCIQRSHTKWCGVGNILCVSHCWSGNYKKKKPSSLNSIIFNFAGAISAHVNIWTVFKKGATKYKTTFLLTHKVTWEVKILHDCKTSTRAEVKQIQSRGSAAGLKSMVYPSGSWMPWICAAICVDRCVE